LVPLVGVLLLSFTTWDGIGAIHPSGLTSWRDVLIRSRTAARAQVTFLIMALSWLFQTPMSILLGVFLAGRQRYRGFLPSLFIPLLLSSAAIAITYKALLDPNFGLGRGLHLDFLSQDWLGQPNLAVATVVFVVSWQFIPVPHLDLSRRGAADPGIHVRGRADRRRRTDRGSSSASPCHS
jgi:raffinose/stachyose/melibiose transport system permease protein